MNLGLTFIILSIFGVFLIKVDCITNSVCNALTKELEVLTRNSNEEFFHSLEEKGEEKKIKKEVKEEESDWDQTNEKFVVKLHEWCLDDIGCKRLFFQESKKNLTIFKILLGICI